MSLRPYFLFIWLLYAISANGQVHNYGNLSMHGSAVGLFGNLSNNGLFNHTGGTLHAVGSSPQTFNGTKPIHARNFAINKESNSLQVNNVLQISGMLTFTDGRITTDRSAYGMEYVEFLDGASYSGSSDKSHIDGVVRKTGNDAFVFPTGDNAILRPIGISAPALISDHFTAYYMEEDPDAHYRTSSLGMGLNHVSACEYWILNRTGGSSDVVVTLSWASNSCGVDHLCDLRVSKWDGYQWISAGNGGVTGTETSGRLVSGNTCSVPEPITSFSPFALGSFSGNNPLPISLISFDATVCESSVCLTWQTASEVNNDFFTVERSKDGVSWAGVADIQGAGNSETILNYHTMDTSPFSGVSYYRLKQTDFDGAFEYAPIVSVSLDHQSNRGWTIYPNPSRDILHIKGFSPHLHPVKFYNNMGQDVTSLVAIAQYSESQMQFDISSLAPGMYHIKSIHNSGSIIKL